MPEVNRYRVVLYGASSDKPNLKAKIELYAAPKGSTGVTSVSTNAQVGRIRFHDVAALPSDVEDKTGVTMNLPAVMLDTVVDLLRNEAPVYFAFHEGRAVLGTGVEEIGTRDEHVPQLVRVVDAASTTTTSATPGALPTG